MTVPGSERGTIKVVAEQHLGPFAILMGLALLYVAAHCPPWMWATHIPGGDSYSATWALNWLAHVLPRNPLRVFEQPILHPQAQPRFHTDMGLLIGVLAIPWRLHPSPSVIYHVSVFHCLLLTAWGAYAGLYALFRHRRAAVLGATYFALGSDQMYHAFGHVNIAAPVFYLPALALGIHLDRNCTWPWLALLSLIVLLQFLCSFYLGAMLVLLLVVYMIMQWGLRRGAGSHITAAALGSLLVALAAAWFLFQPFQELSHRFGNARGLHEAARYSASPAGYLLPLTVEGFPVGLPGFIARWAGVSYDFRLENAQWLGVVFPVLAVLALLKRRGTESEYRLRGLTLLVVACVGFILSLGPFLWWRGGITGIRLPYALLHEFIPPFRVMRAAARFALLVTLAVTVLGVTWLACSRFFNVGNLTRRLLMMSGLLMLLVLESLPLERPALNPVDLQSVAVIDQHAPGLIAAPIPFSDHRFLLATARSFPVTPSATLDGVHNHHYRTIMNAANHASVDELLDLYEALDVQLLIVHERSRLPALLATGRVELTAIQPDFVIARLKPIGGAAVEARRQWVAHIPERPPIPLNSDFPPELPSTLSWTPEHWQWLDESPSPPQWVELAWETMASPGYIYRSLRGVHYSGLHPHPLAECARVHIRMRISDHGADFAHCRVQWLTTGMTGWDPLRTVESPIRTDGKWQVVTLDLENTPTWDPAEILTALQFEFTTTPHPGQRVRVSEIRLESSIRAHLTPRDQVP